MFRAPKCLKSLVNNRRTGLRRPERLSLELLESRLTPTTYNVPSQQYPTISAALAAASDGDTILIDPSQGPYSNAGDLNLTISKAVTLNSSMAGVNAVIDCGAQNVFATLSVPGIIIHNLTIENSVTAAVSVANTGVNSFRGCDFESNGSNFDSSGPAAVSVDEGTANFSHCTFNNNTGSQSGAVEFDGASGSFDNCVFTNNFGTGGSGAIAGGNGNLTLTNCTFTGNRARDDGGAIIWFNGPLTIAQCSFTQNQAPEFGGALFVTEGTLPGNPGLDTNVAIAQSTFVDNSATKGGAIAETDVDRNVKVTATDCLFEGNSALTGEFGTVGDGAAIDLEPQFQAGVTNTVAAVIINSSFFGNQTSDAPQTGVISASTLSGTASPVTITNSILFGDLTPVEISTANPPSSVTIDHSDIEGGFSGTGNIKADPLYNAPSSGDFHLQLASPGIGTGTAKGAPAADLNGYLWGNQNGNPNMGAFTAVPIVSKFVISAPSTTTAGVPFDFTVTAEDANNNTVTSYSGTVHFTSSDGAATLPADMTLTNGTGTFSATLQTAGNRTITATDTQTSTFTGTSNTITVNAAAATHFTVSAPGSATAGTAFRFAVTALDAFNNTATSYSGIVHLTSSDGAAELPADMTLTNGTGTFNATLKTAGSQTITATDTANTTITGTSNAVAVGTAAVTHFVVSAPGSTTAGEAFSFTITAEDANNDVVPTYSGTVHFTSSDGAAELPADMQLTNGTGTFNATLDTAGSQTITATDTSNSSITGTSNTVAVSAAPATHFTVAAPNSATAGTAFSFAVTALDAFNNTVTGYSGTVHFTSSDGAATLPADLALTNGSGTFNATLDTAGSQTITATDTQTSILTATSNNVTVNAATATHFTLTAPGNVTAGTAFNFTVTAIDAFNNTATGYTGVIHLTSSDNAAQLPADTTLSNGVGTFSITLKTAGNQTITATDTQSPTVTGTSNTIAASAATATHFTVTVPSSATAGTAFSFTVTALDAFNNTATGYTGTVHFTSRDGAATLPADLTLTNGTGTFSATLDTAGSQAITVTDTANSSISGTSNTVAVSAATATHFTVSAPNSATAGTAFSFTVTALDAFNNTATAYAGTVRFTSSDGAATLPADTQLTNGAGVFNATLKTLGNQTLTVTDAQTSSITGRRNAIAVSAAAATHFAVSVPSSATAGTAFTFTVAALDPFGNTAVSYTRIVHFTSSDGAATLPADIQLTNGTGTFNATLDTAGSQNITATDTSNSSISGTSDTITVNAAAATHFTVSVPSSATAGMAFSFTVAALDAFNNTATGYTGVVHLTSSDSAALLPADSTLSNGVGAFSATFGTEGLQTITATDKNNSSIQSVSTGITVDAAPSITSGSQSAFTVLASDNFVVTTTGFPTASITESGILPNGITFLDRGDGTAAISGTTTSFGTFPITFTAKNGIGQDATQTFTLTVSGIPPYATTPNERFIAQVYLDLLHRFVEKQALDFWAGFLDQGQAHSEIVLAIEQNGSNEYQTDQVESLYQHYLHRAADPAGLQFGVAFLNGGGTDEQLAATLAGSQEYFQTRGNNNVDTFLNALYQDTLARPIDAGSLAVDRSALEANSSTRQQLALFVLTSAEFDTDFVEQAYEMFLHRSADPQGLAHFVQAMQAGLTDEQLIAMLVGSPEYQQTRVGT